MPPPPHWLALHLPQADGPATWLGTWALQFTPKVVWLDDAWLLDVTATLRMWGGLAALAQHMQQRLAPQPGTVQWALGPTARAALARWRVAQWWTVGQGLPAAPWLLALPVHTLTAARAHQAVLARLGVRTWGQLRRLPRDGVARRWGAELLHALDQALGHAPESHAWLLPQAVFDQTLTWPHHLETVAQLLLPAHQLLAALHGWLVLRQRAALRLRWHWQHDPRRNVPPSGGFELRTAQPTQHPSHWQRLTAEHLARHTLSAPVVSLRLETLEHVPWANTPADWVSTAAQPAQHPAAMDWPVLLERLRARLGDAAVTHWQPQATHVPDAMQTPAEGGSPGARAAHGLPPVSDALLPTWLLPTWLLPTPQPLTLRGHRPCYQGELELLAGPQRLELAHWPCAAPPLPGPPLPTLRDYFVARSPRAGLLWVFRQHGTPQHGAAWFLHGRFA